MPKRITFFNQIRVFLIFFMWFGMWPSWQNDRCRVPLIGYSLYSISVVFGVFTSAFFVYDVIEENSLSNVVAYSFLLSILATHLLIQIEALFKRNAQMKLVSKFDYIDHLFSSRLHVSMPYKQEKCALIVHIMVFIGIILGITTMLVVYLQFRSDTSNFWFHNFYSIWIMRLRCLQVLFFVYLLRARITLLSEKMLDILKMSSWLHGTHRIPKSQRKLAIFVLNSIEPTDSAYDQLCCIKQIYGELYEVCGIISSTFGWSLLAIITQSFIDFVSNSYWTFRALEDVFMDFTTCIDCMLLISSILVTLGTLAFYCASCSQRARSLCNCVNRMRFDDENDAQNELLREFCLQIVHEPIAISANGFFNIDFDLLGSMAAAIITYLVILIQFELSDREIQRLSTTNSTM